MNFIFRSRVRLRRPSAASPATLQFRAIEEAYPFIADDGSTIWASGYSLLDEDSGAYIKLHEQHFDNPHCLLCRVAGVSHRPDVLREDCCAPGSPVVLRPDPTNAYDPNAVGVWDRGGSVQIGFVPAEHSERIASDIRAGNNLGGLILREFRRDVRGPRLGLHILIAPAGAVTLEIQSDEDEREAQAEDT